MGDRYDRRLVGPGKDWDYHTEIGSNDTWYRNHNYEHLKRFAEQYDIEILEGRFKQDCSEDEEGATEDLPEDEKLYQKSLKEHQEALVSSVSSLREDLAKRLLEDLETEILKQKVLLLVGEYKNTK